jgi:hypothetical protein
LTQTLKTTMLALMPFSQASFAIIVLAACITGAQIGCSDPNRETYPVRGIVQFPDGKLLREGTIEFEIMGREQPITATGAIGPDGSFVLGTHSLDDGALAGEHRVVVIADYEIGTGAERPGLIPPPLLHEKYRAFQTSGLVLTVRPETNNLIVKVEYAPQPDAKTND